MFYQIFPEIHGFCVYNLSYKVTYGLTATVPVSKKSAVIRRNQGFLLCTVV